MGVSILLNGKDITPGWRSMMAGLLRSEFGADSPHLDRNDIEALRRLRDEQRKGSVDPPFDWAQDIADAFDKIISRIETKGSADIECVY